MEQRPGEDRISFGLRALAQDIYDTTHGGYKPEQDEIQSEQTKDGLVTNIINNYSTGVPQQLHTTFGFISIMKIIIGVGVLCAIGYFLLRIGAIDNIINAFRSLLI